MRWIMPISHGVVHRDIKPENILLAPGARAGGRLRRGAALRREPAASLTGTGLAIGTPAYMSPEQGGGGRWMGAEDVYSLGCVLYEMLAGEPPYTGRTPQAIIAKRLSDPVPSVRRLREELPEELDAALRRALAKAPADRFAGAAEFAQALAEGGARHVPVAPVRKPHRKHSQCWVGSGRTRHRRRVVADSPG